MFLNYFIYHLSLNYKVSKGKLVASKRDNLKITDIYYKLLIFNYKLWEKLEVENRRFSIHY